MGRHASAPSRRRWILLSLTVVGIIAVAGLVAAALWPNAVPSLSGSSATESSSRAPSSSAGPTVAANCANLTVWAGAASDNAAQALDAALKPAGCPVTPASSANDAGLTIGVSNDMGSGAVAITSVVLGMPTEMAKALGWDSKPADTATLRALLTSRTPFANRGHPEWGGLRIVSPDPAADIVGITGYGSLVSLANGGPLTATPNFGAPDAATTAVIKVEQAYSSTDAADVAKAMSATSLADFVKIASMVVTTERDVLAHNASGGLALTPVDIAGGAALVPVSATGPDAALRTLASPDGISALREAGWRGPDGTPPLLAGGLGALQPVQRSPQEALALLAGARKMWAGMHQRTSVVALIDISGSMLKPLPGQQGAKIDIVRDAAQRAFAIASPKARSALWFFHTDADGQPVIDDSISLDLNGAVVQDGRTHADLMQAALQAVWPSYDTPLYEAIRDAYAYALKNYDPAMKNEVIVLSDGAEDSTSKVTHKVLMDYLAKAYDPKRPVSIICILTNPGANLGELQTIARATKGEAYPVTRVDQVPAVLTKALFS